MVDDYDYGQPSRPREGTADQEVTGPSIRANTLKMLQILKIRYIPEKASSALPQTDSSVNSAKAG